MSTLPRTIRRGEAGPDVEAVRRVLIRAHIRKYASPGGVSRPFGRALEDQVRTFQRRHALTPSGVVGAATWLKMQRLGLVKPYEQQLIERQRSILLAGKGDRAAMLVVQALLQGASAKWEPTIHYSQDARLRWEGIHFGLLAPDNQPAHADCSSYTTWCIWQALKRTYGTAGVDIVNNQLWQQGYTGTQVQNGRAIALKDAVPGRTLCFYGPSWGNTDHVTGFVGRYGRYGPTSIVSHGQENGPRQAMAKYRSDFLGCRIYPL